MKMTSNENKVNIECNILLSDNKTLFSIDSGWEGIPFNFLLNSIICTSLILIFSIIRWKVYKSKDDPLKNNNWLHFIYADKQSNDLMKAKFRRIDRRHHLSYLPPILHHFDEFIPKSDEQPEEGIELRQHSSELGSEKSVNYQSFEEMPTLRSDLDLNEPLVTKINEIYSDFGLIYDKQEEDFEMNRLKTLLLDDYATKESLSAAHSETELLFRSQPILQLLKGFLYHYLLISDVDIIQTKGSDVLQYLLFQRYLIYFQTFLTLICLLILLPINLQGSNEPKIKSYARTTITNLGKGSNLLWIHSFMTLLIVPMGVYIMQHFSKLLREGAIVVDKKILLIENIKTEKRDKNSMIQFLTEKFPNVVIKRVSFTYKVKYLENLHHKLLTAIEAKKYCIQYRLIYYHRCEVRPYCLGRFGGIGCCSCCPKLDGVLYYAEEKAELKNLIDTEIQKVLSEPMGLAFVVFEKKSMAREVFKSYYKRCVFFRSCLMRCGFFKDPDDMDSNKWSVSYAPYPEDIEWGDISLDYEYSVLWSICMHAILLFIFLFLTTPGQLTNLASTAFSNENTGYMEGLKQLTKPYLLMIMTSVLPALVLIVQHQIPYKTKSALNHSLLSKTTIFLIFMVLILPPLNLLSAAILFESVLGSEKGQNKVNSNCLFPSGNSGFFINYVLSTALVGTTLEIMRFSEIVSYFINIVFMSRSVAEYESVRQQIRFQFSFGIKYPKILLIFTIIVTYSTASPLIAPAGLVFLVIKHLVDRYNLYYVYSPTQINSQMHTTAVYYVYIALFFLLIQVYTNLSQYEDKMGSIRPSTPILFTLIAFLIGLIFKYFKNLSVSE